MQIIKHKLAKALLIIKLIVRCELKLMSGLRLLGSFSTCLLFLTFTWCFWSIGCNRCKTRCQGRWPAWHLCHKVTLTWRISNVEQGRLNFEVRRQEVGRPLAQIVLQVLGRAREG